NRGRNASAFGRPYGNRLRRQYAEACWLRHKGGQYCRYSAEFPVRIGLCALGAVSEILSKKISFDLFSKYYSASFSLQATSICRGKAELSVFSGIRNSLVLCYNPHFGISSVVLSIRRNRSGAPYEIQNQILTFSIRSFAFFCLSRIWTSGTTESNAATCCR